ncbi:MAG: LysR substrate-binding domain-containing protein, partial [Alphaproteobacteria bacterium]
LPDARLVETAAIRVERRSLGLLAGLTETVRIEAMETAAAVFARGLDSLADGPGVEIAVTGVAASPNGRMPEIRVRHGLPASGDGITRRIGSVSSAVYGAPRFAEGRALPLAQSELAALPWLGYVEAQDHYVTMRWLQARMRGRRPASRLMRTELIAAAAVTGVGVGVLPQFLAREWPGLLRLTDPIEELRADYWAVVHPDLARSPAIRTVLAWMAGCFRLAEYGATEAASQPAA